MASLRKELQAIYDSCGKLTPSLVVDEARVKDHPLHSRFEWNNSIAGEKYRQVQAQDLIQSVKIKYQKPSGDSEQCRYFVSVQRETGFVYEPTSDVASDPVAAEIVLRTMEREWKALRQRYGHIKEFMEMVQRDVADKRTARKSGRTVRSIGVEARA